MSEPTITPAKWLEHESLPNDLTPCHATVAAFCHLYDMKDKLQAQAIPDQLFSHLDPSRVFAARIGARNVLAVECLYGGPLSATVLEELAHYGIELVIGFGYAGSLTRTIPVGSIVLARRAVVSDGTSREYLPDKPYVYPDQALARPFRESAKRLGHELTEATVWTTDALYREYPEKIAAWRKAGADLVNMDTGPFYAVSRVVGISAVYACVVSDCVEGPHWEDGFERIRASMGRLHEIVLATLRNVLEVSDEGV